MLSSWSLLFGDEEVVNDFELRTGWFGMGIEISQLGDEPKMISLDIMHKNFVELVSMSSDCSESQVFY